MRAPTAEKRAEVNRCLDELIQAVIQHDLWDHDRPPTLQTQNPTLYNVWDFLNRSKYMLSEFENIRAGRALQYPDQFRPPPGTGDKAALDVYIDVVGRSTLTKLMIMDTSGKTAMLTGLTGQPPVDFGPLCKAKAEELSRVSR